MEGVTERHLPKTDESLIRPESLNFHFVSSLCLPTDAHLWAG